MNSLQKALVRHQPAASRVVTCSCRHLAALPPMPACNFKPQKYTGPTYEKVKQIRKDNLSPGYLTYYKKPLLINQGHMQWLYDHEGTRYLDMFAGIVTVSVGHCHPKVVSALKSQSERLWHTTNIYMHPGIHDFAAKLASKLPGNLKVVYFVNSGSEANDMAMMLARLHTGRYDLITLRNAYHGMSPYLLGMTALSTWRYPLPSAYGIHPAMNADVYRGVWGGARCRDSPVQTTRACSCSPGECQACNMYVDQIDEVLKYDVPKAGIAGFFAESIQGVGGTVQFPRNYLKRVYELVRQNGGLCIADEVQTGFGRTGDHYWGFEGHGVVPDIVTMAKGIGNGFPLAAVVTTPEIAASMNKALHFNTFGGNPLSCAVGSTVLDVIEEDKCQQVSKEVGTHYLLQLEQLRNDFPCVGDVRGKGLMLGLELVTDKASRKPMPAADVNNIWEDCKDLGVLFGKGGLHGNVIRIKPPMCITKDDVNFAVGVLRHVLEKSQSK